MSVSEKMSLRLTRGMAGSGNSRKCCALTAFWDGSVTTGGKPVHGT
jgi:hypothetical protein